MTSLKDYIFKPFMVTEVEYRGNKRPRPRSGHRIACDDVNIYCFGGYNPSLPFNVERNSTTWSPDQPLFKELWSFSIANRKWTQYGIENMPEELASNAMCLNGTYLMVFGGTGAPFGNKCSNDVIIWQSRPPDSKLQVLDATGNRPLGQYGQAVLCHRDHFYAIGGTNGFAYNCDIYRLDMKTLNWESVFIGTGQEGEPHGRYRHEVVQLSDKLFVIGGGTSTWAFEIMEIPVYDLKTNVWTVNMAKADDALAPLPRKCHSAVQIKTAHGVQVFVAGGSDGQSVFDDIWRLNMETFQWTLMKKSVLPCPLYFHSSTVTSTGCMYIFGGIESKDDVTNRNNILYKMWLCVPKLSEICWEALLYFQPHLDKHDKKYLLTTGIPIHLVNRLQTH